MKATIPGEIIDPGRGFEKYDGRPGRRRRLADDTFCQARNLEVIQPADESAFDALGDKFGKRRHG